MCVESVAGYLPPALDHLFFRRADLIRITYVIPTLDQSGAERQLTLLAGHLPQSDFDPHVIALNRGGYFEEPLRAAGIPVTILEKRFRFDVLTYARLRRVLRQTRPDVVQSFLFSANSCIRIPGVCPPETRVIVSERCVDSWKTGWQLTLDRRLVRRMDVMTANSDSVAHFYRSVVGVPDDKLCVIPNGVSPPDQSPAGDCNIRAELGLPPDTPTVGFVGRLARQKCLKDLVWAFHLLHQVVDDVVLILVGDGPERDQLAEFAQSVGCRHRVYFVGHRSDASVIIPQLNVFCLTSAFEGMSNSLMEAMAAGVPVVVSDIPGNLDLVKNEVTGLTVPFGNSVEMCRAAKRLLTDSDLAGRLSTAASEQMAQKFSVDGMVQRHIELYQRISSS